MDISSITDFFYMGGYALYVWSSFGICALTMFIEPWLIKHRHRVITKRLRSLHTTEAKLHLSKTLIS